MIPIIVLAAGEARRMGQPKQVMQFQGESLVQRAVQTAQSVSEKVVVVTGAHHTLVEKDVAHLDVMTAHNSDWLTGMGSSIKVGVQKALSFSLIPDAVIIMLCDQPFVSQSLLQQLVAVHQETDRKIVASAYRNTVGVPALFSQSLFPELLALDGQVGAKHIIPRFASQVVSVDFPEGIYDLDTPEDFDRMKSGVI